MIQISVQGEWDEPFLFQIYIQVTEVRTLNLPQRPCREAASYSYSQCIRTHVENVAWRF